MKKTQTIQESQLAAEVYAQRLAYISVIGKEPPALDSLTPSGYLASWNEAIATVGDPFTDSGQALLHKLQQKAMFHGRKKLYHKGFTTFFFQIVYRCFVDDKPLSELPSWGDLDFSNTILCSAAGIIDWLYKSIGNQLNTKEDCLYLASIINQHKHADLHLLGTCLAWVNNQHNTKEAYIEANHSIEERMIQQGYTEEYSNKFATNRAKFLSSSKPTPNKQIIAALSVERELYKIMFLIDPGIWEPINYITGISRSLDELSGASDLLAVKIHEEYPENFGWGFTYEPENEEPENGQAVFDSDGEASALIRDDINQLEPDIIVKYLYHYDFLPVFLHKLGVEQSWSIKDIELCCPNHDIRWFRWFDNDGGLGPATPARISHTTHWLNLTYKDFTEDDWQYLVSILVPLLSLRVVTITWEINPESYERTSNTQHGKFADKYPTIVRTIDYARFRIATMHSKKQNTLLISATSHNNSEPINQTAEDLTPQQFSLGVTWQGPRTEFIELACALYEAGAITIDGPGGRDAAVERLGSALGITGKTPVSTVIQDIKNKRNGDRQTPLLDRLKTKLLDYLGK